MHSGSAAAKPCRVGEKSLLILQAPTEVSYGSFVQENRGESPFRLLGQFRTGASVVAYSAICPHAGCDVDAWVDDQKILECSCHYSRYNPRNGAAVLDGPAPRTLPALPLKIVDGNLAVAKPFTARVGVIPS